MAQTVAQQIAANSAAWKTASPAQQAILHAANLALAAQSGQTYNDKSGTYSPAPTTAPVQASKPAAAPAPVQTTGAGSAIGSNSYGGVNPNPTSQQDNTPVNLRDALSNAGAGYEIGYDPTTKAVTVGGKTIDTFGLTLGSDGHYSGSLNAIHDALSKAGVGTQTPGQIPPKYPDSVAQANTSTDMLNQIMQAIKGYQAPVQQTLSWQDAMNQAGSVLNPEFDNEDKALGTGLDQANIASGFYGQMPGEILKTETLQKNKNNRANSIANLASSMFGQSQTSANQAAQTALGNQNSLFGMIQAALSNVSSNKQNDASNAIAMLNAQTAKNAADSNVNVDNANIAKINNDVSLANKQFDLDSELKRADLSLAEKQASVDKAYKEGQISVEQRNAATSELNAQTNQTKVNADLGDEAKDKVYKANYNQAYGHFSNMDPAAALNDLLTHSDYYIGQMGTYYNTIVKDMQGLAAKNNTANLPTIK